MTTVRIKLDPANPPKLSSETRVRLDAMTLDEIEVNAVADSDNPPLTDDELDRMSGSARVQRVRRKTGLSQTAFAQAYRINVARLRDLEQGRTQPDSAVMAYLTVIEREPDAVRRALRT